jgi:uncharacterized OB-fold protein
MTARISLTPDNAPDVVFKRRLADGALPYQKCGACAANVFPPRVLCPTCGSPEVGWETSAGSGSVYSVTTVYRRNEEPYNVSLVDLDEGFRMMTSVRGLPPDDVTIGMRVRLDVALDGAEPVPYFVQEA